MAKIFHRSISLVLMASLAVDPLLASTVTQHFKAISVDVQAHLTPLVSRQALSPAEVSAAFFPSFEPGVERSVIRGAQETRRSRRSFFGGFLWAGTLFAGHLAAANAIANPPRPGLFNPWILTLSVFVVGSVTLSRFLRDPTRRLRRHEEQVIRLHLSHQPLVPFEPPYVRIHPQSPEPALYSLAGHDVEYYDFPPSMSSTPSNLIAWVQASFHKAASVSKDGWALERPIVISPFGSLEYALNLSPSGRPNWSAIRDIDLIVLIADSVPLGVKEADLRAALLDTANAFGLVAKLDEEGVKLREVVGPETRWIPVSFDLKDVAVLLSADISRGGFDPWASYLAEKGALSEMARRLEALLASVSKQGRSVTLETQIAMLRDSHKTAMAAKDSVKEDKRLKFLKRIAEVAGEPFKTTFQFAEEVYRARLYPALAVYMQGTITEVLQRIKHAVNDSSGVNATVNLSVPAAGLAVFGAGAALPAVSPPALPPNSTHETKVADSIPRKYNPSTRFPPGAHALSQAS